MHLTEVSSAVRRGIVAVFESVFRLSPVDSVTENEGDLLKAMVPSHPALLASANPCILLYLLWLPMHRMWLSWGSRDMSHVVSQLSLHILLRVRKLLAASHRDNTVLIMSLHMCRAPSHSLSLLKGDSHLRPRPPINRFLAVQIKVDFVHKNVSYKFSKPLPNK